MLNNYEVGLYYVLFLVCVCIWPVMIICECMSVSVLLGIRISMLQNRVQDPYIQNSRNPETIKNFKKSLPVL